MAAFLIVVEMAGIATANLEESALAVEVSASQGRAEVRRLGSAAWQSTYQGQWLEPGGVVRTPPDTSLTLSYLDGSAVTLSGSSEVRLAESSISQARPLFPFLPFAGTNGIREELSFIVTVVKGRVRADVAPSFETTRLFRMQTSHSIAQAESGSFEVEVDGSGQDIWHSIDGQVFVGYLTERGEGEDVVEVAVLDQGKTAGPKALLLPDAGAVSELPGLIAEAQAQIGRESAARAAKDSGGKGKTSIPLTPGSTRTARRDSSTGKNQMPLAALTCLECHGELKAAVSARSRHQPFVAGECRSCHASPHAGKKAPRSAEELMELCISCHPKNVQGIYHPMGPDVIDPNTKSPLTCLTCHDPHGSQYGYLGRIGEGNKLCLTCHSTFIQTGGASDSFWDGLLQRIGLAHLVRFGRT